MKLASQQRADIAEGLAPSTSISQDEPVGAQTHGPYNRVGTLKASKTALTLWLLLATLSTPKLSWAEAGARGWQQRALAWQDPRRRAQETEADASASHAAAAEAALQLDDWGEDMPAIPLDAAAEWVEVEPGEEDEFSMPSQEELLPLKDPEVAKQKSTTAAMAREAAKAHIERLALKQPLVASHKGSRDRGAHSPTISPAKAAALKAIGMASHRAGFSTTGASLPSVPSLLTRPPGSSDSSAQGTPQLSSTETGPEQDRGNSSSSISQLAVGTPPATPSAQRQQQQGPRERDAEDGAAVEAIAASPVLDVTPEDLAAVPPWFRPTKQRDWSETSPDGASESPSSRRSMRKQRSSHSNNHSGVKEEWLKLHRLYLGAVEKAQKTGTPWDVIFYGDSIIEEYRGTFLGGTWGPFQQVRDIWEEFFGTKPYRAYAMGIAGDTVRKLLWRLQHGELPRAQPPKVVVLHIGTNDVVGNCSQATAQAVGVDMVAAIKFLFNALPRTHVVTLGILPKGEVWPNRCSPAIDTANAKLQEVASRNQRVHFLDYSASFLSQMETAEDKYEIKETLMPDSMHPSHVGMRIIASQLEPFIRQLLAGFSDTAQLQKNSPPASASSR